MARKTTVVLIDDLDGSEIADGGGETVRFALDGTSYEIDLTDENAAELRRVLGPYTRGGRATIRRRETPPRATATSSDELAQARDWLRSQGHEVADRGRIKKELLELWRENA
jgi:hypothetical protein